MKYNWNKDKNEILKQTRNISFEEIVEYIKSGFVVKESKHFNQDKYPNQRILYIRINDYIFLVPYIQENKDCIFLKTIYPSREWTEKLIKGK